MGKVWKRRWLLKHSAAAERQATEVEPARTPAPAEQAEPAPEATVVEVTPQVAPKKVRRTPRQRTTSSDE